MERARLLTVLYQPGFAHRPLREVRGRASVAALVGRAAPRFAAARSQDAANALWAVRRLGGGAAFSKPVDGV